MFPSQLVNAIPNRFALRKFLISVCGWSSEPGLDTTRMIMSRGVCAGHPDGSRCAPTALLSERRDFHINIEGSVSEMRSTRSRSRQSSARRGKITGCAILASNAGGTLIDSDYLRALSHCCSLERRSRHRDTIIHAVAPRMQRCTVASRQQRNRSYPKWKPSCQDQRTQNAVW